MPCMHTRVVVCQCSGSSPSSSTRSELVSSAGSACDDDAISRKPRGVPAVGAPRTCSRMLTRLRREREGSAALLSDSAGSHLLAREPASRAALPRLYRAKSWSSKPCGRCVRGHKGVTLGAAARLPHVRLRCRV